MLKIQVFRAIDDIASCKIFAQEHAKILQDYDIIKITSFKTEWFYNPSIYVIIVKEASTGEIIAGERIHLVNADYPLPVEQAFLQTTGHIYESIATYPQHKIIGEMCALWSKKSAEGYGLSVLLIKLGIALAHLLKMSRLYALCSPRTVSTCELSGFKKDTSIGNNGEFLYPSPNLIATAVVMEDMGVLSNAEEEYRKDIFSFFNNPVGTIIAKGKKESIEVKYNITVPKQSSQLKRATPRLVTRVISYYANCSFLHSPAHLFSNLYLNSESSKISTTYDLLVNRVHDGARSPPIKVYFNIKINIYIIIMILFFQSLLVDEMCLAPRQ